LVIGMRTLGIDIETYSSVNLQTSGVYAYTAAPDFEVLLIGYAFDDEPVQLVDLAMREPLPAEFLDALEDPGVVKTAHNANFERVCLARHFRRPMPPEQWWCTAVHAAMLGYPRSLESVAKAMKLTHQKSAGKALIRYFCLPCRPTKRNNRRTRNRPAHDPGKWMEFRSYCKQDVEVERAIYKTLERFPVPETERRLWALDQRLNDAGVCIDPVFVDRAIECSTAYRARLEDEAMKLTGLENPNSVAQIKQWLKETEELEVETLNKETLPELLALTDGPAARLLEIRREVSKTSCRKYEAMTRSACDGKVRGLLRFYGAGRTGRWAGQHVQVHNLPQNHIPDLALARQLVREGSFDAVELLYESVPGTLSQLVRTAFIPSPGCRFIIADFSAIEARIIAWLAGEKWRMDVFRTHGKIYEASAAQMFKVPIATVTKGSPLRQKGKISELALGYQGSKGALITMGALNMGLKEEELPELVISWRRANPNIVRLWHDVEDAALKAVCDSCAVKLPHGLEFIGMLGFLFIRLPSGRRLSYVRPQIVPGPYGDQVAYFGMDQTSKKWKRIPTYGGKLVENIVQAIARDCLAEAMLRLDEAGYNIVMHVHDEVVLDMPCGVGSLEEACEIMGRPLAWAPGLPLRADGFEAEFYQKD
jgi:DNA polymerase